MPNFQIPDSKKANIAEHEPSKFTKKMLARWIEACKNLPEVDKNDIMAEEPLVNGGVLIPWEDRQQVHAEFKQTSY